jgi:hypothetical protein
MRERITIPVEGIINEWRKNNKEQDYKDWHNEERQMGSQSEDGFHPSSRRIIYQECEHDRENPGLEEGLTQGARLRHADAYVLYKPRWTRAQCQAPGTTRKGEVLTLEKDLRANESSSPKLKLNGFVRQRRKSRYRVKALLPPSKGRLRLCIWRFTNSPHTIWSFRMRYLLLLSVLLLGTCWAVAQDYQNQANQTSAGTQTTVQSCLSA